MPLQSLEPGFVGAWHAVPQTQRRGSKYLDYLRRMILGQIIAINYGYNYEKIVKTHLVPHRLMTSLPKAPPESLVAEVVHLDEVAQAAPSDFSSDFSAVWRCFVSTFITIFLAELGDKTQVATLLMSAQSHEPWVVFGGAAAALVSTSLVGVLLGQWLAKFLTPKTLELATGGILAVVSVLLLIDVAGMP